MSGESAFTLGEIFDIARGASPRPIDAFITDDAAGINWISIGDASAGSKYITQTKRRVTPEGAARSRPVKPGDFLLTNSMSFGRPYIMQTSGCIHDGWLHLRPKLPDIDQGYFYHLLGSGEIYAEFSRLAAGATVKNLNTDLVSSVKVKVPPLADQRRIAAILDEADALRAKRRAALARLDEMARAIFVEMFGDPVQNSLGLPLRSLKSVGRVSTGSTPPGDRPGMFGGNIPFVTPGDLGSSAPVRRSLTAQGATAVRMVRAGAAMVCCIGATIGKMDKARSASAFNQQINAVEWSPEVNDDYGIAVLTFFKRHIAEWGASTTLPILKKSAFENIQIPVAPRIKQLEFARRVAGLEGARGSCQSQLEEFEALFASLQHRAFRGEL